MADVDVQRGQGTKLKEESVFEKGRSNAYVDNGYKYPVNLSIDMCTMCTKEGKKED